MSDFLSTYFLENTKSLPLDVIMDVVELCYGLVNIYNEKVNVVLKKKVVPYLPCLKTKMVMT